MLFTNAPFRWAFLLCSILACGGVLSLVKVWPSTPPYIPARVRISMVDWIQAQALARNACSMTEATDLDTRLQQWRSAIGNDPGSLRHNRGYLQALFAHDRARKFNEDALQTVFWTLRLSHINQTVWDWVRKGCSNTSLITIFYLSSNPTLAPGPSTWNEFNSRLFSRTDERKIF